MYDETLGRSSRGRAAWRADMVSLRTVVQFELLSLGNRLWSAVKCVHRHDRLVVYATMRSEPHSSDAFRDSERILRSVLHNRLMARDWVAVVLCGDRVSYTVRPRAAAVIPLPPRPH
jgi:hypothetical protein